MATTKTLTPTNQTITIAAFQGEKPDQRQIADAETKMADAINALNSHIAQIEKRAKSTSATLADGASMTVAQSNSAGLLIVKVTGQNIEYVAVHGFMYINQYAKNLGNAIYTYNYMGTAPITIEMASNGIKITNTSGKSAVVNALLVCESNAV